MHLPRVLIRKNLFTLYLLSFLLVTSLTPRLVLGQTSSQIPRAMPDAVKAELIAKHTKVTTSDRTQATTPTSMVYQMAIGQILINPELGKLINKKDLELLENLPGHTDEEFLQKEKDDLEAVCRNFKNNKALDIFDVSIEFENAAEAKELRYVQHYERIQEQLSDITLQILHDTLDEIQRNVQFVETQLDFQSMSSENPDLARDVFAEGCDRFEEQSKIHVPRKVKLKDEILSQTNSSPFVRK